MGSERDEELTRALAVDPVGGFEALVYAYQHRLYAFSLAMSGEPMDAEEIAQDTFMRAHAALSRYPSERIRVLKLNAWLHQIALNVFRNRARKRKLRLVPLDPDMPVADSTAGPERQVLSRVVLRCVQGMTYAEVAVLLGQPEGTIKASVHRGLQTLKRRAGALSEVS